MKINSSLLTLCVAALVLLLGPSRPRHEFAWRRVSETEQDGHVSRLLAANDTNVADVLIVLDFTVSPWHRQQLKEFAAALVGTVENASTNSSWGLHFGIVIFSWDIGYELQLTDDYATLQQRLLDPLFGATFGSGPRNTAAALQLCSEEIARRGRSTAVLVLTAGVSADVPGTIQRAAELKVEQQAVVYAIALDDASSRSPSRVLELEAMSTDSTKEFNVILPPPSTTTTTATSSTATSSTATATSVTETSSTATSATATATSTPTSTSTTQSETTLTVTTSSATSSTATSSTKTTLTSTSSTVSVTSSTSSTATMTTSTSSTITATTTSVTSTSSTSSTATVTTSTSSTVTATTTSSTSSTATRTTSTSSTATVTTSTSSSITMTSTSLTETSSTATTSTATTSTATSVTATSTTSMSNTTTSMTTTSTMNATANATTTATTSTTTFEANSSDDTTTTITSTTTFQSTADDRRLFGNSNPIALEDLGSLLGLEIVSFFTFFFASLETSTTARGPTVPTAGSLEAGIVVVIVLATCCLIAVLMAIAFFAWHSMYSDVAPEPDPFLQPVSVVLPPSIPPPRPPPPQPRDATQKALKEAIDMQDITKLRQLLSEILLKGWPEEKYTDLVLKGLEVVATLKESAADVLEEALSQQQLPPGSLADARFAGVDRELVMKAEGLRQRQAMGQSAGTLG